MKRTPLTPPDASALVSELRAMASLPPGANQAALERAKAICFQLEGLPEGARSVPAAARVALSQVEILLSRRRWKTEAGSVESLQKSIKSACDRLRVAVEAALHAQKH
jgi:hypothetical protein